MSNKTDHPTIDRCECGAGLLWDSRESPTGKRWLALCESESCGAITGPGGSDDDEGGLQTFLLGTRPLRRELTPWTRFIFRASAIGHRWKPAPQPCSECGDEFTSALELRWNPQRAADPFVVILCSRCGATTLSYFIEGERVNTSLTGKAWFEPAPQITVLRRALHERAALAAGYQRWDFE
jgi:hypothetical protein